MFVYHCLATKVFITKLPATRLEEHGDQGFIQNFLSKGEIIAYLEGLGPQEIFEIYNPETVSETTYTSKNFGFGLHY